MLTASCHCGAVRVDVPATPSLLSDCNCSICRRYGVRWAYYPASQVTVHAAPDAIDGYHWGRHMLRFVRCHTCGCVTHWERIVPVEGGKMGVNARNFDPRVTASILSSCSTAHRTAWTIDSSAPARIGHVHADDGLPGGLTS